MATEWAQYLADREHGSIDTDFAVDFQPDKPTNVITIYNTTAPALDESQALAVDQFTIQVLVRNSNNSIAREKIKAIHKDIIGFSGRLVPGADRISATYVDSMPAPIGRDENNRAEWSAHYRYRVESQGDQFRS